MDDMTKMAIGATAVIATTTAVIGGVYILGRSIYRAFKKPETDTSKIETVASEPPVVETPAAAATPEFEVITNNDEAEECLGEPEL